MKRLVLTFVLAGSVLLGSGILWADDTVYFREPGKKKESNGTGTIEEESPSGIKLKTKTKAVLTIPALEIVQVEYGNKIVDAIRFRAPDGRLLKALAESRADKKAEQLRAAQMGFEELDRLERDGNKLSSIAPIHRYLQYRIAQTMALQARDNAGRDAAITALKEYKNAFADGWEIVPALRLLASLQEDKGDAVAASQTYSSLAEVSGIPAAMKLQSQLQAARLLMRASQFDDAETKLKQVETSLPADDPQRAFVAVYLLQSRIVRKGNLDGIDQKLEQILRASKDGKLRGLAHNVLGDYYRAKGDNVQAFWEYCKVDMLYNQDTEEHAKALYYLWQLFDKPPRNDPARAEEFLTRLKSSQFDGTLYQRQALAEKKKGE